MRVAKAPRERLARSCRTSSSVGSSAKDTFEDIEFFVGQFREIGADADRSAAIAGMLHDALLLDLLLDWTEDDTIRRKILHDNPAGLYGFDLV